MVWEDRDSDEYPPGLDYHQLVVCNYCTGGNAAGKNGTSIQHVDI